MQKETRLTIMFYLGVISSITGSIGSIIAMIFSFLNRYKEMHTMSKIITPAVSGQYMIYGYLLLCVSLIGLIMSVIIKRKLK